MRFPLPSGPGPGLPGPTQRCPAWPGPAGAVQAGAVSRSQHCPARAASTGPGQLGRPKSQTIREPRMGIWESHDNIIFRSDSGLAVHILQWRIPDFPSPQNIFCGSRSRPGQGQAGPDRLNAVLPGPARPAQSRQGRFPGASPPAPITGRWLISYIPLAGPRLDTINNQSKNKLPIPVQGVRKNSF